VIKCLPALTIDEDTLRNGLAIIDECIGEILAEQQPEVEAKVSAAT
jgi:hypothetical protein